MNLIETAVAHVGGITAFTKALNEHIERPVTYQAVRKWIAKGRLPRTEWTGETNYSAAIESITSGAVPRLRLLHFLDEPTQQKESV
ncbi:hypothetical protein ABWH74_001126 [Burkholderia vietnamiensis]|jgi:hypothetical protein|uniref:hypothetical protein n=1 Tax=Burkholderia vietnamiensis TaxID=60552 RepID=UPI001B8EC60C|nr:hypothetical protein [Burkholderia vietnamiensis]MBR8084533.1 hypothetical protein [Burkholderia vietnamiensis]